jgi:hypothetical protein
MGVTVIAKASSCNSPRWLLALVIAVVVAAGGTIALTASAGASSQTSTLIPDSVPAIVKHARIVGSVAASERMSFALPLKLTNQAALNSFVGTLYSRSSRNYRQFLTPKQFGRRFGASSAQIDKTLKALQKLGFKTAALSANHLYVTATGTVATVSRAFGTPIDRFEISGVKGKTFYANTADIRLPASLHGLVGGPVGLDSTAMIAPTIAAATRSAKSSKHAAKAKAALASPVGVDGGATPCAQADAGGGYTAPDFGVAYDFNGLYAEGYHGEGMSAALVEFDDFHDSNVKTMESCYGITTPVTRRLVDGGTGGPPGEGEAEDMADITTLLEMDPKLAHLYVYEAPITGGAALLDQGDAEIDLYNAFVTDDSAPVLSASWGDCEEFQSQAYDQLFGVVAEEAAAQGQQIFDAAGDSGAVDCRGAAVPTSGSISVEMEAAVPWITGVGGTDLSVASTVPGALVHHEDTWNDGGAGGGGQSAVWTMPAWQSSYLTAAHETPAGEANDCGAPAGQFCRMVPDIAMNADPDAGDGPTPPQFVTEGDVGSPGFATYCGTSNCSFATLVGAPPLPVGEPPPAGAGGWYPIGGTSLATPLAASAAVLWDQEAKHDGLGGLGFLNPSLYRVASNASKYAADFHDITTDTNDDQYDSADCPTGCNPSHLYAAGTGYDMASGLGSIDAAKLGADLIADAGSVDVTPSSEQMYGYLNGPSTTQPVSVTSGYHGSAYSATSDESWLHVAGAGTIPGTLSWHVDPTGLSSGSYTGHITIHGQGGSTATLTVLYSVGPRAAISVSSPSLQFAEDAINTSGAQVAAACNDTTWNDELKTASSLNGTSDTTAVDPNSLRTLGIRNGGPSGSTLHFEAFFHTNTSSWLTQDMNPGANPSGFQTSPTQPLVPTSGALSSGSQSQIKLASIANANAVGGYPRMNQGTYDGTIEIHDLADPSVLVTVPVTLVLGTGAGTPTIATTPGSLALTLASGAKKTVNLALKDSSATCGYAYSLGSSASWATVNPYLMAGTVAATPATGAPSATDTGSGNGFTPITISAGGLSAGVYHATITINSQNAVASPTVVPITLTVTKASTGPSGSGPGGTVTVPKCTANKKKLTFKLHPPNHAKALEALIYVNGKLKHTVKGKSLHTVTFARPSQQKFNLKVVTKLSDGERWQRTASYNGCKASRVKLKRTHAPTRKKKKKKKK